MKTNAEWKYWGKRDPLWSVASWKDKGADSSTPWTAEEFLALGASDFADVRRHWTHYGIRPGRCVEIGCGSGRMTKQLAETFESVLAVDVSEDQILAAKALLGAVGRKVEFQLVDEPALPAPDGSCDAVFSCHVLQHLSGERAVARYLKEAFRVLRSNGTVCFHLPVPGAHLTSTQSSVMYWLKNLYKRIKRTAGILSIAEYHRYGAPNVLAMLAGLGFDQLELRVFAMTSNGDYHSYFFARKP